MTARRAIPAGLVAALLLAGCGGQDAAAPKPPPGSPENPLVGRTSTGDDEGQKAGATKVTGKQQPSFEKLVERQKKTAPGKRFSPCSLVSTPQAKAIVGSPVTVLEAPQGPTCIYRGRAADDYVTVAVQTVQFDKLRQELRAIKRLQVGGRRAVCGRYGQPVLYLPLKQARVLTVSARCAVARQFAATALRQLG
jgi:hypothetical protein